MLIKNKDIAEKLNISPSAVSLARNGKPGVSQQTRSQVFAVLKNMEKQKDSQVDSWSKGNITLIVHKKTGKIITESQFFLTVTEEIQERARMKGYGVNVVHFNINDNIYEFIENLKRMNTSGILLLATEMGTEELNVYQRIDLPMVILDNYFIMEKQDSVVIHNIDAEYKIVRYLKTKGFTNVGYLRSKIGNNNFIERYQGFCQAMEYFGLKIDENYVFTVGTEVDAVYSDMKEILKHNSNLPDVLIAGNDMQAIGAIRALKEDEYRLPDNISIVGFDDMPVSHMMDPPLTSIRIGIKKFGECAVERLVQKIENYDTDYITIRVGCDLMIRQSVKDMNKNGNK